MKSRATAKADAAVVAKSLIDYAVRTSAVDPAMAKRQAALARRVMLRFNVRLDFSRRRFICHGCKTLIVPGVNARVRLSKRRSVNITCLDCGHTNRRILEKGLNRQKRAAKSAS